MKNSPNVTWFFAFGALLVALKTAPSSSASDIMRTYGWFSSGMAAFVAISLGIQAITATERRPSPWNSTIGRTLWVLRPRSWMIAWAVLLGAVALTGTPHLAVTYPPRACVYFGLNGFLTISRDTPCPWWRWF